MTTPLVIEGAGWVTPLGRGIAPVVERIERGDVAGVRVVSIGAREFPVFCVDPGLVSVESRIPRMRRSSAISHFAVAAVRDAIAACGWSDVPPRTAMIFCCTDGGVIYSRKFFSEILARGAGAGSPLLFPETVYNAPASHVAAALGLDGDVLTLVGDGAVVGEAILTARDLLGSGASDAVVLVAAQEADAVTCAGYAEWGMARGINGPGATLAEGAAAVVLTSSGSQRARVGAVDTTRWRTFRDASVLVANLRGPAPGRVVVSASGARVDAVHHAALDLAWPGAGRVEPGLVWGDAQACLGLQCVVLAAHYADETGFPVGASVVGFQGSATSVILTPSCCA